MLYIQFIKVTGWYDRLRYDIESQTHPIVQIMP